MDKNCDKCNKKDMKRKKEADCSIVQVGALVLGTGVDDFLGILGITCLC